MAHLIENMAFAGELPWHKLGTEVQSTINSEDMLRQAGLDWTVEQWPISASNGEKRLIVDDSQHNVRIMADGSISSLGTVGHKTHVLQNSEAFAAFAPFIENGLATWESAGSLDNGRKVWALARIVNADTEVRPNDNIAAFALLTNPHDGSGSLRVGFTPIRVICANTMKMAHASKASKLIRINHSQHIVTNVNEITKTMDLVKQDFAMSSDKFAWLATRKSINRSDLEKFTRIVFNLGDKPTIDLSSQAKDRIQTIDYLFDNGLGNGQGSWYDAYNAVTEFLSHRASRNEENRYDSLWYGQGDKLSQLALDTAFAMAV
jgi:phage/plasmid-like protein (TIGR03299 family)